MTKKLTNILRIGLSAGLGLALPLLAGCGAETPEYSGKSSVVNKQKTRKYEFSDFGEGMVFSNLGYSSSNAITSADVDGDGDPDIIILSRGNKIYILENKMPQKNKQEN